METAMDNKVDLQNIIGINEFKCFKILTNQILMKSRKNLTIARKTIMKFLNISRRQPRILKISTQI
jgi:hypothetical protein